MSMTSPFENVRANDAASPHRRLIALRVAKSAGASDFPGTVRRISNLSGKAACSAQ